MRTYVCTTETRLAEQQRSRADHAGRQPWASLQEGNTHEHVDGLQVWLLMHTQRATAVDAG